jgi:hypothetical protein
MSISNVIKDNGKVYQLNLPKCGIKVQSKTGTWYYTSKFGPNVLLEKQKYCKERKKRKAATTTKKKQTQSTKKTKTKSTKKTKTENTKNTKKTKNLTLDEATALATDVVAKQMKRNVKKTVKSKPQKSLKNMFLLEEAKVKKEFQNFLNTVDECNNYGDYEESLESCFQKFITPILMLHKRNDTLFEQDEHGYVVSQDVLKYLDEIIDCVKSRKTKCKITEKNKFLNHIQEHVKEMTSLYIDEAARDRFDSHSTYDHAIAYVLDQVAIIPSFKYVEDHFDLEHSNAYRADLETLELSPIQEFIDFIPKFSNRMNKKIAYNKLFVIGLMAESDKDKIRDYMEENKAVKKKKTKKKKTK